MEAELRNDLPMPSSASLDVQVGQVCDAQPLEGSG